MTGPPLLRLILIFHSVADALVLIFPTIYAMSGGLLLQWLLHLRDASAHDMDEHMSVVLLIIWHILVRIIWHTIVPSVPSLIPRSV
jgi:hypothetical protein